jgi:hypothetical protein
LASTILLSVIGFLGGVSLALSTDIVFLIAYFGLKPQNASANETGQHLICLCKQIGNLEQLLNDAGAVRIALGSNVRSGSIATGSSQPQVRPCQLFNKQRAFKLTYKCRKPCLVVLGRHSLGTGISGAPDTIRTYDRLPTERSPACRGLAKPSQDGCQRPAIG